MADNRSYVNYIHLHTRTKPSYLPIPGLLAHHGVKREVASPALAAGPAGAGPAGTARPMAPQPKAQAPDKRR
jgi:hypothetical protein